MFLIPDYHWPLRFCVNFLLLQKCDKIAERVNEIIIHHGR